MKLTDCFRAALAGYLAVIIAGVVLWLFYLAFSFPSELFYWIVLSGVLVVPLIMGFVLGVLWSHHTIAFDELLPACLRTLLLFGMPFLIVPSALPFYLLVLPISLLVIVFAVKIGIAVRHYHLIEELLGK
jgi:hypothetical protein